MSSFSKSLPSCSLDLETLELDTQPTYVLRIGTSAIDFEIIFANEAFRGGGFRDRVLRDDRNARLFRAWSQAVAKYKETYEYDGHVWTSDITGTTRTWKVIRAAGAVTRVPDRNCRNLKRQEIDTGLFSREEGQTPIYERSKQGYFEEAKGKNDLLNTIPRANLVARWESIQTMMEMSDVGVFEYTPSGQLINANDAWYRLSSHPRDLPSHSDFSFVDLIYPEDRSLVLSMWNTLALGNPVTFEMRWKAAPGSVEAAQWVLSACVPVFDDEGNLLTIAGNTIDINAQKKSQEVTQARVEALERARLSELKFARFAQISATAIYIFKPGKGMEYVNDQFFELTGCPRVSFHEISFLRLIAEEDVRRVEADWISMMEGKTSDDVLFRLKKTWVDRDGICSNIWVQGSSYPELDENRKVISIMGTLFDISQFKWAEGVQRRRIEEALEAKRQQENFIDMTSHELRNPLSAVVQCADSVIATLQEISSQRLAALEVSGTELIRSIEGELATSIDNLQTIVSCSLHQKRIIDDVLTLSKLDSNLILITPVRVQPAVVVSEAMKMFEVECNQMGIDLAFVGDESLKGFEWVMLDPSRLLQVLINLLTNAIKFTKDRPTRNITVILGGSPTRPPAACQSITFPDGGQPETDLLDRPEWGTGCKGYLWLKVKDTGCGMTEEEQTKLFSRFSQATPRTHVKYGGSGLGLFISKSLATLQGGAIGVGSEADVGSTFAFYVSTRIAQAPEGSTESQMRPMPYRTISAEEAMRRVHLNVLIVEDNIVNQKVLRKQLQKFGWNVSVAGNGVEALDWLKGSIYWRGNAPGETLVNDGLDSRQDIDRLTDQKSKVAGTRRELDIILMDIEMPVMDGLTCARSIRDYERQGFLLTPCPPSVPRCHVSSSSLSPVSPFDDVNIFARVEKQNPRIPILAVSANARSEQVEQALAAGMDDAIAKPFRIPELWPKVAALVERISGTYARQ